MPTRVSVVVPVYNPGPYIERCIRSVLEQTMPAAEFEVVFVDDGSTDETPARLDRLAAERANVRVIHQPNSGWPGKPRNVGVDAAQGEYVQFLDQDDTLGKDALARMYAAGAGNHADVVLGKVTSDFRGVPHLVFRENVERCTIRDAPLIDSLTPHKMFRREFLDAHQLRYPEGKRRLEDQLFMVRAYLAADVATIVGDYPCYFYRKRADGRNAGSARIDPAGYYANLREVLDAVEAGTEPGELRNRLLRRFYRGEMLSRVSEPSILTAPDDYRHALFAEVRRLALERFPDAVPDGLAPVPRVRSVLVREDRLDDLVAFAARCKPVQALATLRSVSWRGGCLRVEFDAELGYADGTPLLVVNRDNRPHLDPRLVADAVEPQVADAAADLATATAYVVIRDRDTAVEWFVPAAVTTAVEPVPGGPPEAGRVVFSATAELDPLRLAGGAPLPRGAWDLSVRVHALGLVKRTRVGARRAPGLDPDLSPAVLGRPARVVVPYFTTPYGNLTLDVGEHGKSLAQEVAARGVALPRAVAGRLEVELPARTAPGTHPLAVRAVVAGPPGASSCTLPARIRERDGTPVLIANLLAAGPGPVRSLRPGTYRLLLQTGRTPAELGEVTLRAVDLLAADARRHAAGGRRRVAGVLARTRRSRGR